MNQFCVPNRIKVIKKTSSGLIESFNIKKIRNLFKSSFFIQHFYFFFFAFLSHLETIHFSYQGSPNDKPPLRSNEAQ